MSSRCDRGEICELVRLVSSIRLFRDPATAALHLPWVEQVRGQVADLDLLPLLALVPPEGYIPDFFTPPPRSPLERPEDELELVRRTPAAQVVKEMDIFRGQHGGRLPDLRYRATRLTEGGPAALFSDLHPTVSYDGPWLHVDQPWQGTVELEGRGLLLVPAAFSWARPSVIAIEPWQPTLIYPARGVALLWEQGGEAAPELAGLVGETRARMLAALDAPHTTTELAALLGLTAGGVSQHLSAMTAAGVVSRSREGRVVLYTRTQLGDSLVAGK